MSKFHINKHGVPAPCRAKEGNCPLGGTESHFNSQEEAQVAADRINEEEFGILGAANISKERLERIKEGARKGRVLSNEEIERMRDNASNIEIIGSHEEVEIMSNEDASLRLAKLKAERYNVGSGEFSDKDFSKKVGDLMDRGLMSKIRDNGGNEILSQFGGEDSNYEQLLSTHVGIQLKKIMESEEPTYYSEDDYNKVLHKAISRGTSSYLDEVGEPFIMSEHENAKNIVRGVLGSRPEADLSTHSKMIRELKTFSDMNERWKGVIEGKISRETNSERIASLESQLKKAEYGIESAEYGRHKLSIAKSNVDSVSNFKNNWPNDIATSFINDDNNKELISDMKTYHKKVQEDGNIYYKSMKFN